MHTMKYMIISSWTSADKVKEYLLWQCTFDFQKADCLKKRWHTYCLTFLRAAENFQLIIWSVVCVVQWCGAGEILADNHLVIISCDSDTALIISTPSLTIFLHQHNLTHDTWRKEKDDADIIVEHFNTFKSYDEVNSTEYFTCLTYVWNTQLCSSCAGSDWTMGCSSGIFSCFSSDDAIRTCFYMTRCQQVRQEEGDHGAGHTLLISACLKVSSYSSSPF